MNPIYATLLIDDPPANASYWARLQQLAYGYVPAERGGWGTNWRSMESAPWFRVEDARAFADMIGGDRRALAAQAQVVHAEPIALDRITVPTLVIAGDADPLATRPEVLADAIAGSRLEVVSGDHTGALGDPRFIVSLIEFLAA